MVRMERFLWVCLGGAAGSAARYLLTGWIGERLNAGFPWGTLCVNVSGSFLLGAIMQLASTASSFSPTAQATLTIGVLGGFTTYSTFNYETLTSFQQGAWTMAAANVVATVAGCLAAGLLGQAAARALFG